MGNYYLYIIARFLMRRLPLRLGYSVAVIIADFHYTFSTKDRQSVENNLKVIQNTTEVDQAQVRAVFRNFGKYLVDFFTLTKYINKEYIAKNVDIINLQCLKEVLDRGKGGILVSAHLGNWEMGGVVLPLLGYPLSMVALPHKDPRVNEMFNHQREMFGSTVMPTTVAVRRCLEHLKTNRLVAMLVERDFNHHGIIMDFLGRPTMIPKGAAVFAIKTGAPVIPAFFTRLKDDRFQIEFLKPIEPPLVKGDIPDDVLKAFIRQYLLSIEIKIKEHPSQWLMFREFWYS